MSLLNGSFLNEAINEKNIEAPNEILNHVRNRIIQSMEGSKDGMDAILIRFEKNKITYSSAQNKAIVISNNIMSELPYDKMPVGKGERTQMFTLHSIPNEKNNVLYFFTDGYTDQFGGINGKKFKYKQLQEKLSSIHHFPLAKQKQILEKTFEDWKGNLEQVDDILLMGIII
jgi:serine phosphatase RsbU (regulator of sigma subunit)